MILQALATYYKALAQKGEIARPGWGPVKVTYALALSEQGELERPFTIAEPDAKGKKLIPKSILLPFQVKRSSGVAANFLCDNATYLLGLDSKGDLARAQKCFEACRALHLQLLRDVDTPLARAVCAFFDHWNPEQAEAHPALIDYLDALRGGVNLVFLLGTSYAHEDDAICQAWQQFYDRTEDSVQMQCLVTGKRDSVALLHPNIKGLRNGQSMGNSLVSFNARAYESYGREQGQGLNAPVSQYAAFAYGTALNHLLADRQHQLFFSDTTVVFWSEDGQSAYQAAFRFLLNGPDPTQPITNQELFDLLRAVQQGRYAEWNGTTLDADCHFYILGLAPNAARLSVRFFLQDTFGSLLHHLYAHHKRLEIVRPAYDQQEHLSLWSLLQETVNQKSTDKKPSPQMTGDVLRAIITNGLYPATLYQNTMLRIRADREVTRGRAAIIKAYLLQNTKQPKEALEMQLNDQTAYQPYVLGRMFSVLESIQQAANPSINTTIRDKYFTSACTTPTVVLPTLLNLADKHLRKLEPAQRTYYAKQLGELTLKITESYPAHHTLEQQGIFQLGYYHQTQKRFEKKAKQEEEQNNG